MPHPRALDNATHATPCAVTPTRPDIGSDRASDDWPLVRRLLERDEQAFAVLYTRYAPALRRTLSRTLHPPELADEVVDDVMLVLWREAAHVPATVPLGAWLHGIARHKAWKALRRQAVLSRLPAGGAELSAGFRDPETLLLQNERERRLARELEALSPPERLLLEQWLYQGCSYQEMAVQTGAPLTTVKARIFRGRRRLAARLGAPRVAECVAGV
jgi:RNA polymerase sigma-70 factor (ECF subfamily)